MPSHIALLALVAPSLAGTLVVDPSDSAAYATVQEAIDDAATRDLIHILAGTFPGCLDPRAPHSHPPPSSPTPPAPPLPPPPPLPPSPAPLSSSSAPSSS